jgi:hypothetical protein
MSQSVKVGHILGNGSAQNIELGFIPDYVKVINVSDGDKITEWFRGKVIPFSSGGANQVVAGDTIVGATSGARAFVRDVLLASGTWAGGDAAGFFLMNEDDITGTFGSENVYVEGDGGSDDATVTVQVEHSVDIDTEVAAATGNAAIISYVGDRDHAKGFTIGSTISEDNKLLRYIALRSDR